ncbi:MAG: hypothetical protein JRF64_07065 [Deltaproteobacteria bacterium]|nr:hypothetical protein [Deltaproteobacteria bacterium]
MGREKKRLWVYVLIALIGLVGFSLAKYITSVQDVGTPKPAAKYPDKKSKGQTESITVPKAKPGAPISEYKPQVPSEVIQPRGSQTPEVQLRPVISEDKRLRGDAPSARKLPSDEREADFTPKPRAKAAPPTKWFKEGKALDDEPEEETAAEKLQRADDLSVRAAKRVAEARWGCDCELLVESLELANEAAVLVWAVAAELYKTGDIDLAQRTHDLVTNVVGATVAFIRETCTHCPQTSLILETVECFEQNCLKAEEIARFNAKTIDTTIAAGALPGLPEAEAAEATDVGPPIENELPIRDHEQPPASPV